MLRNQATALLRHEHLTTTVPRAKELRPFVERLITIAKRGLGGGERQRPRRCTPGVWSCRICRIARSSRSCSRRSRRASQSRPGGYTRLLRLGFRRGDAAEVAQVELVGSEFNPRAKAEAEAKKPKADAEAEGRRRTSEGRGRSPARQEGRTGRWRCR